MPATPRARDQGTTEFPPFAALPFKEGREDGFDIVNEGSVRAPRKRGLEGRPLEDIIVWLIIYKAHAWARPADLAADVHEHEFC
jgi:hypothetical protein